MAEEPQSLQADHVLEYPYKRSTGPVIGRFFTGLRNRELVGIRARDGRVISPPLEYDPVTGEALSEFIEVGPTGAVQTWTWVSSPRPNQPLDRPFAWALILLDGSDTSMLHAVDAGDESAMRTGMRVRPRWAAEPTGDLSDLECFEPVP